MLCWQFWIRKHPEHWCHRWLPLHSLFPLSLRSFPLLIAVVPLTSKCLFTAPPRTEGRMLDAQWSKKTRVRPLLCLFTPQYFPCLFFFLPLPPPRNTTVPLSQPHRSNPSSCFHLLFFKTIIYSNDPCRSIHDKIKWEAVQHVINLHKSIQWKHNNGFLILCSSDKYPHPDSLQIQTTNYCNENKAGAVVCDYRPNPLARRDCRSNVCAKSEIRNMCFPWWWDVIGEVLPKQFLILMDILFLFFCFF